MTRGRPIESVADAQRRAKRRLPGAAYWRVTGASEAEVTVRDNVAGFEDLALRPLAAMAPAVRSLETTVVGQALSLPVILSPVGGLHAVHPSGERAVARAASRAGTAVGLSTVSSDPVEAVAAACAQTWFQLYFAGGRHHVEAAIARADAAGCRALIVTIDHIHGGVAPDRAQMRELPADTSLRSLAAYAPRVATRPAWVASFLRSGGLRLKAPNVLRGDGGAPMAYFEALGAIMRTPPPTWDDLAWIRSQWAGPLILKGITTAEDTKRAIDVGADAVSVSNHGGNALDGSPGTIRMLPEVVGAANGQLEVLLDGGIRRGSDVVKALALGARAVLVGRPYVWAFAARGEDGVVEILEVLRRGIDKTISALGCASVADLDTSHVLRRGGWPQS